MATIVVRQYVTAVCRETNEYTTDLTIDQIREYIALSYDIPVQEVDDGDVQEWLETHALWTEGETVADEITYRDNDSITLEEV